MQVYGTIQSWILYMYLLIKALSLDQLQSVLIDL